MSDNYITQLSVRNLLINPSDYLIPMYQRNYAWEEGEITQLIQDIIDYLLHESEKNYYIGTLVVFERTKNDIERITYETIDGQQRFTTLSLLASYLKNESDIGLDWYKTINIHFENRPNSTKTLDKIFAGTQSDDIAHGLLPDDTNVALMNGYRLIRKLLPQKLQENNVDLSKFTEYLLDRVQIVRVKVPKHTDLNHYFEIMNNRGEQLEKHEILKSKIMAILNKTITNKEKSEQSQNCLHTIWEACSNMEKYVQLGFVREKRDLLFGANDWGQLKLHSFDEVCQTLGNSKQETTTVSLDSKQETTAVSLEKIILDFKPSENKKSSEDEAPERFSTVINFPNFLLHVLRIQLEKDIPLDDKRLITTFNDHLLKKKNATEADTLNGVKQFIFNLLKCKRLFDHFIIKREFLTEKDRWSLQRFKCNNASSGSYVNTFGDEETNSGENRRILMLLSAFHVSAPTLVYKHWLNAALYYLFHTPEIKSSPYLNHLESVAKSFVFDRFLCANDRAEYASIIYENKGILQSSPQQFTDELLREKLSFGNIENNLVFNYLDYLLWCDKQAEDKKIREYEFTFRSSVEHYYPQNPMPGYERMNDDALNSFGNLCLISHSKNSRLSNFMPEAKKEYYKKNTIDSIKQYLMMKEARWDEMAIEQHYKSMKKRLLDSLEPQQC